MRRVDSIGAGVTLALMVAAIGGFAWEKMEPMWKEHERDQQIEALAHAAVRVAEMFGTAESRCAAAGEDVLALCATPREAELPQEKIARVSARSAFDALRAFHVECDPIYNEEACYGMVDRALTIAKHNRQKKAD